MRWPVQEYFFFYSPGLLKKVQIHNEILAETRVIKRAQEHPSIMSQGSNISNHDARLPIWVLSPREEKEARSNLKQTAYKKCDDLVRSMAECAKANGLKLFPACEKQRDKMTECILFYQVDTKYLDQERDKIVERKINRLEEQIKRSRS
ncbi:hypothetical protein ZYGR_0AD06140 [Zygosaccharomyces rouxii]|uniref:COX assembly mitochondrial protein n=2 Tax=Zygosaccharomyces rouxii TaxID=4956 RepID=C5E1D9_ZYGRC|nr:uncharacterized protein ZYRO0G20218g [Zygosaccharomyces rouxii]KAH9202915.1 cytochrome c oxidase biogenesis protein Cmc1 like-domain-containing protein [Zygosaccharomyces rouxii]GAV51431.1 hypothetical protein ZYGR_0AD06140 [Zygosaccharomyces rouxii]CAR29923.1 ZYRO0G20218p [Zygosaccharomyces rouxii]